MNVTFASTAADLSTRLVGRSPTTIGRVVETVESAPIRVDVMAQFVNTDSSHDQMIQLTLQRDGDQISEPFHGFIRANTSGIAGGCPGDVCAFLLDADAVAGSHTWSVTAQLIGGTDGNAFVTLCRIILQEMQAEA